MDGSVLEGLRRPVSGSGKAQVGKTVAVVIPVFKHSVLLAEALESALAQRCSYDVQIVIVDDGCPFVETETIGRAYALTHPQITYLRKPNGGLSSARNHGIDYCLRTMPDLAAVYFLDADNRITPIMIEEAMALLERSPDVDWIYPNIDKFGIPWAGNFCAPYSRLLHVAYDNICEAGSLVSRRLLDAGIRFDESMKSGFEDWDFWLQSIGAGFRGLNHPYFGFDYRQRAESMLRDSNRVRSAIINYLRDKHKKLFAIDTLLRWEHEEAPRFAFVNIDTSEVSMFTDPTAPYTSISMEDFVQRYWASIREPDTYGIPPFMVFMKKAHLDALTSAGLVHNLLWIGQRLCKDHHFLALRMENDNGQIQIDVRPVGDDHQLDKKPMAWMCGPEILRACVDDVSDDWIRTLRSAKPSPKTAEIIIRGPFGSEIRSASLSATNTLLAAIGALRDSGYAGGDSKRWAWRVEILPKRSKYHELLSHTAGASPLMPRLTSADGPVRVGFLLPIASFGGVEKVAYAVAAELNRLGCEAHLFVLGKAVYQLTSGLDQVFKSINFLSDDYPLSGGPHTFAGHDLLMGGDAAAKSEELIGLLTGLDVVINCQIAPVNAVLGELRRRGTKVLGHMHVIDQTFAGREVGHPYIALAFEHVYDMLLTCSQDMVHWFHGMGVPYAKLMEIPNAPSYDMPAERVKAIVAERRNRKGTGPLRVLFMGRLDTQKGIERLYGAAVELRNRHVNIDWRIIGSEVVNDKSGESWTSRFESIGVAIRPPMYSAEKITEELTKADVLVLPSRWEGAPLTILEAQRLGCVPVVAAVGATNELIDDSIDGVLVKSSDDWAMTRDLASALELLASDRAELSRLSEGASARVAGVSWKENVAPLVKQLRLWFPTRWQAAAAGAGE